MLCKKCGAEIQSAVKFCPKCGTKITENDVVIESDAEIRDSVLENKESADKKANFISNIISIIIVIALIWILISGAKWLFSAIHSGFSDNKNGTGTQATDNINANDLFQ